MTPARHRTRFRRDLLRSLTVLAAAIAGIPLVIWLVPSLRAAGSSQTDSSPHIAGAGYATTKQPVTIPVDSGVSLSAYLWQPQGPTSYPLIIMPGSWGSTRDEYNSIAAQYAGRGYGVVAYAQRGFGGSGGAADFAGAPTQQDESTVLTWALAHSHADPTRVGALGLSYGAGVSLLAAAHDHRIRTVVAMSTWTDLSATLAPHGTLKTNLIGSLLAKPARLSPELQELKTDINSKPTRARKLLTTLSPSRSPAAVVADLNRQGTAVLIVNGFEDSLMQASTVASFFTQLASPKRLLMIPGDHAAPLTPAALSSTGPWPDAAAWLDHYLGVNTPTGLGSPVQLTDVTTGARHSYASWPPTKSTVKLRLGYRSTGTMTPAVAASWSRTITTGIATAADSGFSQFDTSRNYVAPTLSVSSLASSPGAYLWNANDATSPTLLSGSPALHITVSATAARVSLFTYLYDVTATGSATLISATPDTLNPTPGQTTSVDIELEPTSWTLAAGHHLGLVIDTVDARYPNSATTGAKLTLTSTTNNSAALTLGLG